MHTIRKTGTDDMLAVKRYIIQKRPLLEDKKNPDGSVVQVFTKELKFITDKFPEVKEWVEKILGLK